MFGNPSCAICPYWIAVIGSRYLVKQARANGKSLTDFQKTQDLISKIHKDALDRFENKLIERIESNEGNGYGRSVTVPDIAKAKIEVMKELGYDH